MPPSPKAIHVAVAVIRDGENRILVSKRPPHVHQGGRWEFPGGKLEPGESISQALCRELEEELGIIPTEFLPLIQIHHHYPEKEVYLDVWEVYSFDARPVGREGQEIRWISIDEFPGYEFPQANIPIVKSLRLSDYYLITPDPTQVKGDFIDAVAKSIEPLSCMLQLRAKSLNLREYAALARDVRDCCTRFQRPLLLNGPAELLESVDADGIHLPVSEMQRHKHRPISTEKLLACSTHSRDELLKAQSLDIDFAVLGPVRPTASHSNVKAMGWEAFSAMARTGSAPIYALGGVGKQDFSIARRHGARGIAAIRDLWKGSLLCPA